jgi:hypothetical protein
VEGGQFGKRQEVAQEEDVKAQTQKETQAPALAAPQEAVVAQHWGSIALHRSWPATMRHASTLTQPHFCELLVLGASV